MRRFGEFGLWLVAWSAYAIAAQALLVSSTGVSVIWLGGGLAAGFLLLRPVGRWWLVLVPFALALAGWQWSRDMSTLTVVVRSLADAFAAACYALIVQRHRTATAGLGSSVGWVSLAALTAAVVRFVAVWGLVLLFNPPESNFLKDATTEIGVGTMVGVVAGSATVLGVFAWNRSTNRALRDPIVVGTALAGAVLVVLVFVTPVGSALPGSEYLIVPLLLAMAVISPAPVTALVVGLTLVMISIATANSLGVYRANPATSASDILAVQLYLIAITVSAFLLASVADERRRAQTQAAHHSAVMSSVFRDLPTAAAWVTVAEDQSLLVRQANPAFLGLLGVTEADTQDVPLDSMLASAVPGQDLDVLSGRDLQVIPRQGSALWLRPTLSRPESGMEFDGADEVAEDAVAAVLVLEDVTDNHASEELLRLRARRDSMTRLPSRQTFIEQLNAVLEAGPADPALALFIVDVDGLKAVNHSFGPEVGDQVLVEVVRRVALVAGEEDLLARTAGDELAILRRSTDGRNGHAAFAERVLVTMHEPFAVGELSIAVTVSIGVAQARGGDVRWDELMRWAEVAVRDAKAGGRDRAVFFDPSADPHQGDRLRIGQQLREVVAAGDLVCLYQPLMEVATGKVTSAELLVRMHDGAGDLVAPEQFLHLADNMGLMGSITEYVMREACEAALAWHQAGTDVRVAFNAPPAWLSAMTVGLIDKEIARTGVPRELITVEVTEDRVLDAGCDAYTALAGLRSSGVHVAIDDFGTGYSGLDSFRSSPADIVKVDMAFVSDMLRTQSDREIVRSILDLIHRFGKTSVAEGVETTAQLQALREMGCTYAQGYLVGRPMTKEEFPAGQVLFPPEAPGRHP
ncbi:MAG: hypothetical protein QG597_313 [Actinomycetota bacterium]|nr:hypothetical protein [Actinomycetota bacterium]